MSSKEDYKILLTSKTKINKVKIVEQQTCNWGKENRIKNAIWFNASFSLSAKIIGKFIFKMLQFHRANPLSKICNKNAIKISYNYKRNLKLIISSNNKQLVKFKDKQTECNFRVKNSFPLGTKCLTFQLICQAYRQPWRWVCFI